VSVSPAPMPPARPVAYDFGGRLSAGFPSQIWMDITEVCNLACIHCSHPDFKLSPHYGARSLDPELNSKMVDEVRRHGGGQTEYIRYSSNGEPLVHPQAYAMIDEAVRHSGVFVTLTTNGTIMDEKRTTRLLESGVHMIDISIDAFRPETYAKVRRNGKLQVTRGNVQRLIQWVRESRSATKVVVSFVEQPENAAEAHDFEAFWKDAGAHSVVIRRLHSCSGALIDLAQLRRAPGEDAARRPCLYPWERIGVTAGGTLAFCPSDWVHGSTVADYRTTTIKEAWQGAFYKQLRQAHLTNDYQQHGFCGQCPDWKNTRWPGEGRRYADLIGDFVAAPASVPCDGAAAR
jgi:MoaA/NifB/PqqE/SkfB family radical SAM enzyme